MVRIDLRKLSETAYVSIRRAYVFMGLGVNAADSDHISSCHLPGIFSYSIVPKNISDEQFSNYKSEFRYWIVGSAIREIIEGFEHFLRGVYDVLLFADRNQNGGIGVGKLISEFDKKGVSGRLELLRKRYGCEVPDSIDFSALTNARNCLTHNRGVVRTRDTVDGKKLVLSWRVLKTWIKTNDGKKIDLDKSQKESIYVEKGGNVFIQSEQKIVEFVVGDRVQIAPVDLEELCFSAQIFVGETQKEVVRILERLGVKLVIEDQQGSEES